MEDFESRYTGQEHDDAVAFAKGTNNIGTPKLQDGSVTLNKLATALKTMVNKAVKAAAVLKTSTANVILTLTTNDGNTSNVTIPGATSVNAGVMSATDKAHLDELWTGGGGGGYEPPVGGIPKSDLANDVQESLNKADTALQSHQDISDLVTRNQLSTAIDAGIADATAEATRLANASATSASYSAISASQANASADNAEQILSELRSLITSPTPETALAEKVAENTANIGNISRTLGEHEIEMKEGWILNNGAIGTIVDFTPRPDDGNGWHYAIVNLKYGDRACVSGVGGSSPRTYAVLDKDKKILSQAAQNNTSDNVCLMATQDSAYLVINDKGGKRSRFFDGNSIERKTLDKILESSVQNGNYFWSAGNVKATWNGYGGMRYIPIHKGDMLSITAVGTSQGIAVFAKEKYNYISYSTQPTFICGTSSAEGINVGESKLYTVDEDGYLYFCTGTDDSRKLVVTLMSKFGSGNYNNEKKLEFHDKNVSVLQPFLYNVGGSYTQHENSVEYVEFRFNAFENKKWNGKYDIFIKIKASLVMDDGRTADEIVVMPAFIQNNYGVVIEKERQSIKSNEWTALHVGSFELLDDKVASFINPIRIGACKKNGILLTGAGTYNVESKYYFIVKHEDLMGYNEDEFAQMIDYDSPTTVLASRSIEALHALVASKATEAEHSGSSELATRAKFADTSLKGGVIGFYGDSLVTYMNDGIKAIGNALGAYGQIIGQGGGTCWNQNPLSPDGFCTLERCATLRKGINVIICYGGANDVVTQGNYTGWTLDEELLGSMADQPMEFADMLTYRVTQANKDMPNHPGRVKTFYQGYKTWLRNLQALFPNALIISVIPHKYYVMGVFGGKEKYIENVGAEPKAKAIQEVCEEFGIPVVDLRKCGVNDYNRGQYLVHSGGVAVHQKASLMWRETSMILSKITELVDRIDHTTSDSSNDSADVQEMRKWVVDVRQDNTTISLADAIPLFMAEVANRGIELKHNMLMVAGSYYEGSSYFLIDENNPTSEASWDLWVQGQFADPNEPSAQEV